MRGNKGKKEGEYDSFYLLDEHLRLNPKNPPKIPINTSVHLEIPAPLPAFPAVPAFPFHLSMLKITSHTPPLAPGRGKQDFWDPFLPKAPEMRFGMRFQG